MQAGRREACVCCLPVCLWGREHCPGRAEWRRQGWSREGAPVFILVASDDIELERGFF